MRNVKTVEVNSASELLGLLKSLIVDGALERGKPRPFDSMSFTSPDDPGEQEIGGDPAHDSPECQCASCRLSRYELPLALEGDELHRAIIANLKAIVETADRTVSAGASATRDLMMRPLSADAERVLLQYRMDRLEACRRAERGLVELLPEAKRPSPDVLTAEMPLAKSLDLLERGRKLAAERLALKRAEAMAERAVAEAADEVTLQSA